MAAGPCVNLVPCMGITVLPRQELSWRLGKGVGKKGKTAPMASYLECCPSKAPLPLWSLAAPCELPALGCTNPAVLQQAQHHSPHQQEPICRPGCAGRKHN